MKIGILTLPLHTNYGGILQAFALQTVLERLGHQTILLDIKDECPVPLWRIPLSYAKRIILKILKKNNEPLSIKKRQQIIVRNIKPFIENNIHRLPDTELHKLKEQDFEAIVVGSDQIWRKRYFDDITDAYLEFAQSWNIKRFAYAASFGLDHLNEYKPKEIKCCRELLKKFDAVSVRESSGVNICHDIFNREALHVLDPTMLLTTDDYRKLITTTIPSDGDLGCYILDENTEINALVELISTKNTQAKLQPFYIKLRPAGKDAPLEKQVRLPVERWLRGFVDAKFIVTDSFHVCVFSILFNKPFVVVANLTRGAARFESLLKIFNLEKCIYSNSWTFDNLLSINWDEVNNRLEQWRLKSYDFLKKIN